MLNGVPHNSVLREANFLTNEQLQRINKLLEATPATEKVFDPAVGAQLFGAGVGMILASFLVAYMAGSVLRAFKFI